jgi:hypothetical protein
MIFNYKNHCIEEAESASLRCEKNKKHKGVAPSTITKYFGSQQPYKNFDPMHICFIEDLVLFVAKEYENLSTMECFWFHCLVMRQNGKVRFPIQKQLVKDHIPLMFVKTIDHYVIPTLA